MKPILIRAPNWVKVRQLCKTSYDQWVVPPPIECLTRYLKKGPLHYGIVYPEPIIEQILNQLKVHDPLFKNMSEKFVQRITTSITHHYCGHNKLDIKEGGSGMIIPSFVEIMAESIFWIENNKCIDLFNESDKQLYSKYYWTLKLRTSLIQEYMMDDIEKMKAS